MFYAKVSIYNWGNYHGAYVKMGGVTSYAYIHCMKKIVKLVVLVVVAIPLLSCLNTFYDFNVNGKLKEYGDFPNQTFSKNFDLQKVVQQQKKLLEKLEKEKKYTLLSDYAVGLMKLGKAAGARDILITLLHYYPREYRLTSNLGTAYELTGEIDSAYKYIAQGIELNPKDHNGSEWIHLRILETKKQLKANPNYLGSHTVLDLTAYEKKDTNVYVQLLTQLQERVPFSPGPDPIMASLMVDLGDLAANTTSLRHAVAYYTIAQQYYGDKTDSTRAKLKATQKLADKYTTQNKPTGQANLDEHIAPLGYINYKQLLVDRNSTHYKPGPNDVFADVNELLGLVSFGITPLEAKTTTGQDTAAGSPQLVLTEADTALPKKHVQPPDGVVNDHPKSYWKWLIGLGLLVITAIALMVNRGKRPGS